MYEVLLPNKKMPILPISNAIYQCAIIEHLNKYIKTNIFSTSNFILKAKNLCSFQVSLVMLKSISYHKNGYANFLYINFMFHL